MSQKWEGLWMKEIPERETQGSPVRESVPWTVMDWHTEGAISFAPFAFPFSPPPPFEVLIFACLCFIGPGITR